MDMDLAEIEQFFQHFDTDQRGYITYEQFEHFCDDKGLPNGREIFETMDKNKDGRIEKSEFVNSFNSLVMDDSVDGRTAPGIVITYDGEDEGEDEEPIPLDLNENISNNNSKSHNQELHRPGFEPSIPNKSSAIRRRESTPGSSALRSQSWHNPSRNNIKKSRSDFFVGDDERIYSSHQETWESFAQSLGESFFALTRWEMHTCSLLSR